MIPELNITVSAQSRETSRDAALGAGHRAIIDDDLFHSSATVADRYSMVSHYD